MVGSGHLNLSAERARGFGDAVVVGSDDYFREIAGLACTLIDMLQNRLSGEGGERFSWKTRGGEPGWNYAQNSRRHNRS
jgi:hypothetical protein